AGTLARFQAEGSHVHLAVACNGNRGGTSATDVTELRRAEARCAAQVLGAPIEFLGLGDADVWDTPETRLRFVQLLRVARPDLVLTHGPTDYHDDHVRVGDLAGKCSWFAASAGLESGAPPLEAPPALFYMDNIAGIDFEPAYLVDISDAMEV